MNYSPKQNNKKKYMYKNFGVYIQFKIMCVFQLSNFFSKPKKILFEIQFFYLNQIRFGFLLFCFIYFFKKENEKQLSLFGVGRPFFNIW